VHVNSEYLIAAWRITSVESVGRIDIGFGARRDAGAAVHCTAINPATSLSSCEDDDILCVCVCVCVDMILTSRRDLNTTTDTVDEQPR